jgi:hypothetical protein
LENLCCILQYRLIQDVKAEEILSFLNIPRFCSITKFRAERHVSEGRMPYVRATNAAHLFDKSPKVSPPCRTYLKPLQYLATTAFQYQMDLEWWTENREEKSIPSICNKRWINPPLCGRDHMAFQSAYFFVKVSCYFLAYPPRKYLFHLFEKLLNSHLVYVCFTCQSFSVFY